MRVCFFGTYEADYDRNRILIRALELNQVEVLRCHFPLWTSHQDKTRGFANPLILIRLAFRVLWAYATLTWRYLRLPAHDVVCVGYMGHLDVFPARLLTWLRRKPLVFDAFISLFDTLTGDRAMVKRNSLKARAFWLLDRWSCALADGVLLDTQDHIRYFSEEFRLDANHFHRVLAGADDRSFFPVPAKGAQKFRVFHYSKFAPVHGIPFILDAAEILADHQDIEFLIVGDGQIGDLIRQRLGDLEKRSLKIEHRSWMDPLELRQQIADAGACLGIFGATAKARRVVPNKVYQCMAAGGMVITGDCEGSREVLRHGEDVWLCPMADGEAIAQAILEIKAHPELAQKIRSKAVETYQNIARPVAIGEDLSQYLKGFLPMEQAKTESFYVKR